VIQSDDGSEWKGKVNDFFQEHNIYHRITAVGDHNVLGIVDKFSKTIKTYIWKYFTENNTTKWIIMLQQFFNIYNNTPHSSLDGFTPNLAKVYYENIREIQNKRVLKSRPIKLNIGDKVRIKLKKGTFDKGYLRSWSKDIYTITNIIGNTYIINNNNEYRAKDLQKIDSSITLNKQDDIDVVEKETKHGKLVKKQKQEQLGEIDEQNAKIILPRYLQPTNIKRQSKKVVKLDL
jgi:hypothetical protein